MEVSTAELNEMGTGQAVQEQFSTVVPIQVVVLPPPPDRIPGNTAAEHPADPSTIDYKKFIVPAIILVGSITAIVFILSRNNAS